MVSPLPRPNGGQNFRPKKLAISVLVAGRLDWVDGGGVVGREARAGLVGGEWRPQQSSQRASQSHLTAPPTCQRLRPGQAPSSMFHE